MSQKQQIPRPYLSDKILEKLNLYTIVDCALLEEEFYHSTIKNRSIQAQSLFDGTPHAESAVAGPLLIQLHLETNADLIKALQNIETQQPAVVWLWSKKDFKPLSTDLQKLLFGELENGKKMFFRYFDPRNLEGMLAIFKESEQAQKVLKHIQAWAYLQNGNYKYLTLSN